MLSIALLFSCKKDKSLEKDFCEELTKYFENVKKGNKSSADLKIMHDRSDKFSWAKIFMDSPISDQEHLDGSEKYIKFDSTLTRNLYINKASFQKLVLQYSTSTVFTEVRIQYVFLNSIRLNNFLSSIAEPQKSQIRKDLESRVDNIYGILTFVNKDSLKNESYLAFDITTGPQKIVIKESDIYNEFKSKYLSAFNNPNYLAKSEKYDIKKVKEYIAATDLYVNTCGLQPIKTFRLDFCYGKPQSGAKESIFLATKPIDTSDKEIVAFPYYDQGSLEP